MLYVADRIVIFERAVISQLSRRREAARMRKDVEYQITESIFVQGSRKDSLSAESDLSSGDGILLGLSAPAKIGVDWGSSRRSWRVFTKELVSLIIVKQSHGWLANSSCVYRFSMRIFLFFHFLFSIRVKQPDDVLSRPNPFERQSQNSRMELAEIRVIANCCA